MSEKQRSLIIFFLIVVFPLSACLGLQAWAVEPSMATYSSVPVFMTSSAPPLIMIILDNSLSMNDPAYSDAWPYDANRGGGAAGADVTVQVAESRDDAEEYLDTHAVNTTNDGLYMGEHAVPGPDHYTSCGMHFPNVQVEQGATITRAYITFKANGNNNAGINLDIVGEASDNAIRYTALNNNVTGRTYYTGLAVPWSPGGWSNNSDYDTPNITAIVQEIVNRPGWGAGHGMAFAVRRTSLDGVRKAYSYDAGGGRGPILNIEVAPPPVVPGAAPPAGPKFYGYFDPDSQYSYDSNDFVRDTAGAWNGNWLNWLCMRRVDVARKVMTGGKAVARTGGGNTSLKGEETSSSFTKNFNGSGWSPYNGNYWFGMKDGYIYVDDDSSPFSSELAKFNIRVAKDPVEEPEVFYDGKIAGVLQRVGEKARWGNIWFTGNVGGIVAN
ncbi:MAG: hypothetical protein KKB20_06100, partial [Proteobacteria bacterium]|nr:hypothetical protein [Pseudomonadota bacterium]